MRRKFSERKKTYKAKLENYLRDYQKILIVSANHVGSHQIQQIRMTLRSKAQLLFGKNTLIRMILRSFIEEDPRIENLLEQVKGNCGLIFTNEDIKEIRDVIIQNRVPAKARPGDFAPNAVEIPSGSTGLDPGQTSFFQALNIATRINRGQIEITNNVYLIAKGEKVGSSECALLSKLNITPFTYGLELEQIYDDGSAFDPEILDLTNAQLISKLLNTIRVIAAIGLHIGIPNMATLTHSFAKTFNKLLSIAIQTDIIFKEAEPYKEYLADPEIYVAKHDISIKDCGNRGESTGEEENKEKSENVSIDEDYSDDDGIGAGGLFGVSNSNDSDSE